jgi:hypothetical protein
MFTKTGAFTSSELKSKKRDNLLFLRYDLKSLRQEGFSSDFPEGSPIIPVTTY